MILTLHDISYEARVRYWLSRLNLLNARRPQHLPTIYDYHIEQLMTIIRYKKCLSLVLCGNEDLINTIVHFTLHRTIHHKRMKSSSRKQRPTPYYKTKPLGHDYQTLTYKRNISYGIKQEVDYVLKNTPRVSN